MGLGDIVENMINIITIGKGHQIADFIAIKVFRREGCNCEKRKTFLNNLFRRTNKKQYPI